MTVTNKLILSSYAFHMNFLVLAIQSVVTVVMLYGFTSFKLVSHRPYTHSDAKKWFPVAVALCVMIYTGSKALQFMSIPLFTIFKNLTIILIAYGELLFYRGAPVTPLVLLSFVMMVASSVIAGWSDIAQGKALKDAAKDVSPIVTYGWMTANCLTTAFYALVMRAKIKEVNFKDFDTVFYNNLLSIPVLVICSMLVEGPEWEITKERFFEPGDEADLFTGLVTAIIVSSVSTMVGALNKLPIAIAGMVFFKDPVTVGGVLGVAIAFTAGIVYSTAKNNANNQRGLPLPVTERKEEKETLLIFDATDKPGQD
ncbi:GDP-mannose transporter into the lumen of the Golgi [Chytridiales sp. JEL 0842]|nr:GDP-mannose transporter into the lumen of the Golgi [Chytridiales sp. JEL 0842]